jgi:hypothetical protein
MMLAAFRGERGVTLKTNAPMTRHTTAMRRFTRISLSVAEPPHRGSLFPIDARSAQAGSPTE